ncbi:hypothetical protein MAP_0166 [Mycobacterium avium subsp. paratuberculosis K-10]|uniref:Type VII secretion protein EccE n=1 Tax=Mycolicibacterium paratuberculosis (strain ATCC BAA-968 / K-10) TaxID=262316 RepID=Q745F5_MYCPA|nr:hypothetical protein MAP_0166 [Mycobacterium avium subsp. paratuberculosis K-10]
MRPNLTGFSRGSNRRVVGVWVVFVLALASWLLGGYIAAAVAVLVGVALVFVRWWGQPAWSWAVLWRRGRRPIDWSAPITVANNRSGGGVRVQDGVAVVAVQLLGRAHRATLVTGSVTVETENVLDVVELAPMLHQALGLQLDSISVVTVGSRHGNVGDYPRVYDSEIGTPPVRRPARDLADHAVGGDRQRAGPALAHNRWRGGDFGCPADRRAAALPGAAGEGGQRHRPGRAGPTARLGCGVRHRAALEGHPRGSRLDDHLRLSAAGDHLTQPVPGVDAARRRGDPERDRLSRRALQRDDHGAHPDPRPHAAQRDPAPAQRRTGRRGGRQHVRPPTTPGRAAAQPAARRADHRDRPVGRADRQAAQRRSAADAGHRRRRTVARLRRRRRPDRQTHRDPHGRRRRTGLRAHPRHVALGQRADAGDQRRQQLPPGPADHRQRGGVRPAPWRGRRGRDLAHPAAGDRDHRRPRRHHPVRGAAARLRGDHRTSQPRGGERQCGGEELACRDGHVPRRAPLRQPGAGQHVRRHVATPVL